MLANDGPVFAEKRTTWRDLLRSVFIVLETLYYWFRNAVVLAQRRFFICSHKLFILCLEIVSRFIILVCFEVVFGRSFHPGVKS